MSTTPSTTTTDKNSATKLLRFGIPTLDRLMGTINSPADNINQYGVDVDGCTASICIMGPDGAGKSIMALHMASRYAADCYFHGHKSAQIFYASTDLLKTKANRIWGIDDASPGFKLFTPDQRLVPHVFHDSKHPYGHDKGKIGLEELKPEANALFGFPKAPPSVGFIDLAQHTAGDDWGFLNQLLASLPTRGEKEAKHLMVIDAIEGLEIFSGERDAFGEQRNRRSRVAQLVRTAAGKCHLVFIVEEMRDGQRLAEEFIADVVLRCCCTEVDGSTHRTLEVVKSRTQAHIAGQHDYVILPGTGTKTGDVFNPDQPAIKHAYIHVHHNIGALFSAIAHQSENIKVGKPRIPTFGVQYLDAMLGYDIESSKPEDKPASQPNITALIGDVSTYKTSLGYAFLAECFSSKTKFFWPDKYTIVANDGKIKKRSVKILSNYRKPPSNVVRPVAVFLTTQLFDDRMLASAMWKHLPGESREFFKEEKQFYENFARNRLICRRLPAQAVSAAQFFHIVESVVRAARDLLGAKIDGPRYRWKHDGRCPAIRLVIDDWSTIKSIYPDVARDPLLLQFLLQYLEWQGVATLVIDSQPGDPDTIRKSLTGSDLRGRVGRLIYTWHVPFFNEDRVAISIDPPPPSVTGLKATIRELRPKEDGSLKVDPHFECYAGLEKRDPRPLPLKVRLYTGSSGQNPYLNEVEQLLSRSFEGTGSQIVDQEGSDDYEWLRSLSLAPHDQRLNHTQIIQVDEFWQHNNDALPDENQASAHSTTVKKSEGARFADSYLNARTIANNRPTPEDPFRIFQPNLATEEYNKGKATNEQKPTDKRRRHSFFHLETLRYLEEAKPDDEIKHLHVVPMMWDFGFLLCRRRSWMSAKDSQLRHSIDSKYQKVWDVFQWIDEHSQPTEQAATEQDMLVCGEKNLSWHDFFQACITVAETQMRQGANEPIYAFDLDLSSTEGFSCLALEIIASELHEMQKASEFFKSSVRNPMPHQKSLIDCLQDTDFLQALLRALLLIFGVSSAKQFEFPETGKQERSAHLNAVASRHWYSTACRATAEWSAEDPMVPFRLPGYYSVRGDWFLTIADGSQSPQLAKGALDLLSSQTSNLSRLEHGVGLPTRSMWGIDHQRTKLKTVADPLLLSKQWRQAVQHEAPIQRRRLRYEELRAMGVRDNEPKFFHWIWRSHLRHYQRHSRIWNRWLRNFTRNWHRRILNPEFSGLDAFTLYREVLANFYTRDEVKTQLRDNTNPSSLCLAHAYFYDAVDRLIIDLQDATPLSPITVPTDTVPTDTVPTDTVPTDTVPTDTVPTDTVPTDTVPTDTVPTDTVPTSQAMNEGGGAAS